MAKAALSTIFILQLIPLAISVEKIEQKSKLKAAILQVIVMLSLAIGLMIVWYEGP